MEPLTQATLIAYVRSGLTHGAFSYLYDSRGVYGRSARMTWNVYCGAIPAGCSLAQRWML